MMNSKMIESSLRRKEGQGEREEIIHYKKKTSSKWGGKWSIFLLLFLMLFLSLIGTDTNSDNVFHKDKDTLLIEEDKDK